MKPSQSDPLCQKRIKLLADEKVDSVLDEITLSGSNAITEAHDVEVIS